MPIEDRELSEGTRLVARYKGGAHVCEVVRTDGGPDGASALRYRLADGREFASPSGAGRAVIGHACNGWRFWSVAGADVAEPSRAVRPPRRAKTSKQTTPKQGRKTAKQGRSRAKAAHARGQTTEGDGAFGCGRCAATFPSLEDAQAHVASVHAEP